MELWFWLCLLGKPPNSFFLPMFGFEEPYLCIHVYFGWFKSNLWLVLSWFSLVGRFLVKMVRTGYFCRNRR